MRILAALRMRVSPNDNSSTNVPTSSNMTSTIARNPEMIALDGGTKQFLDPHWNVRRNTKINQIPSHCGAKSATHSAGVNSVRSTMTTQDALHKQTEKAKENILKMLTYVTASYFICWIPNKMYVMMYMLGFTSDFGILYQSTVILVFINCCTNPIIYIATYNAFKKALTSLLGCQ